jgi:hypothetical protein
LHLVVHINADAAAQAGADSQSVQDFGLIVGGNGLGLEGSVHGFAPDWMDDSI